MNEWLKNNFAKGNPFAKKTAETEMDELRSYYIEPDNFNVMSNVAGQPITTIYYAARGNGKTATAQMVRYYIKQTINQNILVVMFNRRYFDRLLAKANNIFDNINYRLFRRLLCTAALEALPAQFPQVDISNLKGKESDLFDLADHLISQNIDLICFVVDGADELGEAASDPHAAADMILHLLGDLAVMEYEQVAFRFFLPIELEQHLKESKAFRYDRFFQIINPDGWSDNELVAMLQKRVEYFSDGKLKKLAEISNITLLDRQLVTAANKSPRNLIRLGEYLLDHHMRKAGTSLIGNDSFNFAVNQLAKEYKSYGNTQSVANKTTTDVVMPKPGQGLKLQVINNDIYVGDKPMHPAPTSLERIALQSLIEIDGALRTKEELIQAIYGDGTGVTDDALKAVMKRLHNKLLTAYDFDYIITIKGQGWRLRNPN